MKKSLMISLAALSLFVAPMIKPTSQLMNILAMEQGQGQQLVSLGSSLDSAAQQETLALLGANQTSQSNILYVDGLTINRFLQDGSGPDDLVYSSALIQEMPEGYGVQVQIVTPENITVVTPLTYQNAAITAGAKNVQVKIATITPVTGEGALAGVYALLEQSGVAINEEDVQVAQKEISLVNEIEQQAALTNDQANKVLAEIKSEVVTAQQEAINNHENNGQEAVEINQEQVKEIVRRVAANNGITNPSIIEELTIFAEKFAQTDAAKSEDTVDQLDASMLIPWKDTLANLPGAVSRDEILNGERLDFSDQTKYQPIFQAFADTFYSIVEEQLLVDNLYNDTFIYELVSGENSPEEKIALNELRTAMYQYAANLDTEIQAGNIQPGYPSVKDEWMRKLQAWEDLNLHDPVQGEIIRRLAISSGRAPQVYDYMNESQEGSLITYENSFVNIDHLSDFTIFTFDVATGQMQGLDPVSGVMTDLLGHNIGEKYGVYFENLYSPHLEIPADYTIPGYTGQVEDTSQEVIFDEDSSEESSQEEAEETEETLEFSEESSIEELADESSQEISEEVSE